MFLSSNSIKFKCLVVFAITAFIFYLFWNFYFIAKQQIPPSICLAFFHIDAPTTGMTRSLRALLHFNIAKSLYFNPFTLPTIALYFHCFAKLLQRKNISKNVVNLWIATLLAAWIYRLFLIHLF